MKTRKRIRVRAIALLAGVLLPVLGYADALWPSAKYGMSVPEVMKAVPEAKPSPHGSKLVTGAREELRIERVPLAGRSFVAELYFSQGQLVQVLLSLPEWGSNNQNTAAFKDLVKAFSAQYGQNFSQSINAAGSGLSANAEWRSSGENIFISIAPVTQDTSMLNVGFRAVSQTRAGSRK
jgi:hypothetical protein